MMDFHVYVHFDVLETAPAGIDAKLDRILTAVRRLERETEAMSKELDDLSVQVEATNTVEQSAITLLNGLAAQIAALANDPVAIKALAASLKTQSDDLAAAIVANTPAEPPA